MLSHYGNWSVQVVYRGIFHHGRRARKQYAGIGGVPLSERIPSRRLGNGGCNRCIYIYDNHGAVADSDEDHQVWRSVERRGI